MSKRETYRAILRDMPDWDAYLLRESGLPGPRGNLELAQAVADEGDLFLLEARDLIRCPFFTREPGRDEQGPQLSENAKAMLANLDAARAQGYSFFAAPEAESPRVRAGSSRADCGALNSLVAPFPAGLRGSAGTQTTERGVL